MDFNLATWPRNILKSDISYYCELTEINENNIHQTSLTQSFTSQKRFKPV